MAGPQLILHFLCTLWDRWMDSLYIIWDYFNGHDLQNQYWFVDGVLVSAVLIHAFPSLLNRWHGIILSLYQLAPKGQIGIHRAYRVGDKYFLHHTYPPSFAADIYTVANLLLTRFHWRFLPFISCSESFRKRTRHSDPT